MDVPTHVRPVVVAVAGILILSVAACARTDGPAGSGQSRVSALSRTRRITVDT